MAALAGFRPGPGSLRFLLAIAVVASHVSALNSGVPAVMLFFIISGYWVTSAAGSWRGGATSFVVSRALRLYPLFILCSLLSLLVMAARGMPVRPEALSSLTLLGLASRDTSLLSVAWSLDLELQFYLILPLLLAAAQRWSAPWLWLLVLAGWSVGLALGLAGVHTAFLYLPAFGAGMALRLTGWQPGTGTAAAAVIGAVGAAALAGLFAPGLLVKLHPGHDVLEHQAHMLWALLLVPAVALVMRRPPSGLDRELGDASYALYLVHVPLLWLVALLWPTPGTGMAPIKLVGIGVALLATVALRRWVDRPLEAWRRALLPRPPRRRRVASRLRVAARLQPSLAAQLVHAVSFAPLNLGRKHPN